jgi:hypothetical protein
MAYWYGNLVGDTDKAKYQLAHISCFVATLPAATAFV